MAARCRAIAESGLFQGFILAAIVVNAIALGLQTYDLPSGLDSALSVLDRVILAIFTVEIAIRIAAYGSRPLAYFRDGWNAFDFIVVAAAYAPGLSGNTTLLRLVRLLRVVRIASVLPDLRILLRALVRSIPPITSLVVLTLLIMYLYGMVGWILFHNEDPQNWGNIGQALLSTFTMLTLENWPALLEAGVEIHPWSWVFFISYVLIASFLVINILIAIIINSMEEVHEAERAAAEERRRADVRATVEAEGISARERIRQIRAELEELEAELEAELDGAGAPANDRSVLAERAPKRRSRPTKGGRMRG
jgi:voltage-gated sodium channel